MFRVAIAGRPNVGKSTLFNRLTRTRRALVGNQPGMTRDRLIETVQWHDREFEIIDTGGILPDQKELIPEKILEQAGLALDDCRLVLLVVDARAGLTPLDESLAAMVRARGKPILLVANKVDTEKTDPESYAFHRLGIEPVFAVSAEHGRGIEDLFAEIVKDMPEKVEEQEEPDAKEIRIAIIGRPNVGKSSLVNRLAGSERVIVTDIPGTTRDAIDTLVEADGERYRIIDTAGIRRKGKTQEMAEKLSVVMARKQLVRCDVALLILDASQGAAKLDATIGGYAHDAAASVIIVVNKWDLIERDTHKAMQLEKDFRMRMRFLDYAPMIFVSAKSGQRVPKLLQVARDAHRARQTRVPTAELNRFSQEVVQSHVLQYTGGKKTPVLYLTQAGVSPPTFVVFTRSTKPLHFSTVRFLTNQLRERYGFFATPIRILQRMKISRQGAPKKRTGGPKRSKQAPRKSRARSAK